MHDDDPDPLYEPTFIAFVYGAWAATTWFASDRVGLVVLVVATAVLTGIALRGDHRPAERRFLVDFAVVLLFCAAAIALGVLALGSVAEAPGLLFGIASLAAAAVLTIVALRPTTDASGS